LPFARYGSTTLFQLLTDLRDLTLHTLGASSFSHLQTNHEGVLLDRIHLARTDGTTTIILNAGAWTHTSVAVRDALGACEKPFVEVHISNVHARESFRHHSYLSDVAAGVVVGMGVRGYRYAIQHAVEALTPVVQ
jgi:3-dehydroquinate dehydratase II